MNKKKNNTPYTGKLYFSVVLVALAVLISPALTTSCVSLKKVQQTVPPIEVSFSDQLEARDGKLYVDIDVRLPREYSRRNAGTRINFSIVGLDSIAIPSLVIEGAQQKRFNDRLITVDPARTDSVEMRSLYAVRGDTKYNYRARISYEPWMKAAELVYDVNADTYTKTLELYRDTVALDIVEITPPDYTSLIAFMKEQTASQKVVVTERETQKTFVIPFGFDSDLADSRIAGEIRGYLSGLTSSPTLKESKVSITVANSPEGSLSHNTTLGQDRLSALQSILPNLFETADVKIINEDWTGVADGLWKLELEDSSEVADLVNQAVKAADIVYETTSDYSFEELDEIESRLRNSHPIAWNKISKDILPFLRYAEITIHAVFSEPKLVDED